MEMKVTFHSNMKDKINTAIVQATLLGRKIQCITLGTREWADFRNMKHSDAVYWANNANNQGYNCSSCYYERYLGTNIFLDLAQKREYCFEVTYVPTIKETLDQTIDKAINDELKIDEIVLDKNEWNEFKAMGIGIKSLYSFNYQYRHINVRPE